MTVTKNKILLCDCLNIMKKLENDSIDVIFTSPPYNRIRNDTYEYFDDINNKYLEMLKTITTEGLRITKKDVIINIQQNMCNKNEFFSWLGLFSTKIKGIIIWEKTNPQPNTNYRKSDNTYSITNSFEYFIVFNNDPLEFRANNNIKNVITTPVNSEHFEGHGAVMRYDVADFFIKNFTNKGDLVFDPFMGLGTTALACKLNNRDYFGCELIEKYKNMAEQRINNGFVQEDTTEDIMNSPLFN